MIDRDNSSSKLYSKRAGDLIDNFQFGSEQQKLKVNRRPRGRTAGALPCNNPNIDFKDVRKRARRFVGNKAFYGDVMERAISNSSKVVQSNHTNAIHESLGYCYRTRLGIERDIAAWIVLFSTVNLTAVSDRNWFKCYVNLQRVEEMTGYLSLSRGSRFLELYRKTDLLRVTYKKSNRNKERKYCEIFISRRAFELAGVSRSELDGEIERKKRNDKRRLLQPNSIEHEKARAMAKKANRHLYVIQKENYKRKKQQAKESVKSKQDKLRNQEFKREAIELLASLQKSYPDKSVQELKDLLIRRHPVYAYALGSSPPR
ncbi:hypothetical protein [Aliikangiella maris]|uniref:Replication initiation protein n=2 Tax=Aliikangiella maris TaxID=3162458 RepID=A0ABV2BZN4_9GAMM